tara:strand:- start:339 stop:1007 length:669 start_codon:yes stop_codon:yes gene_type:complete
MSWTQDRVAILEKMWTDGKSAAEIAKALGEGVTRNAVIGKAHRMGLSGRPSPIKKSKTSAKAAAPKAAVKTPKSQIKAKKEKPSEKEALPKNIKPIPAAPVKKKKEMPTGQGLSILDLTDRICKWPFGDPQDADFHFCGDAVHPGKPYCAEHCAEAYQTLQRKKKGRKTKLKLTTAEKMEKASEALEDDEDEEDLEDIENLDVDALENSDDIDDDDDNIDVA